MISFTLFSLNHLGFPPRDFYFASPASTPPSLSPSQSLCLHHLPHFSSHSQRSTACSTKRVKLTNQTFWGIELRPTRRSQVQGQGSRKIMGIEWAEISYLRGQQSVCVCVVPMPTCVFAHYLASVFTPAVTWTKVDRHTNTHTKPKVLPDGRWCILWLSYSYPSASH